MNRRWRQIVLQQLYKAPMIFSLDHLYRFVEVLNHGRENQSHDHCWSTPSTSVQSEGWGVGAVETPQGIGWNNAASPIILQSRDISRPPDRTAINQQQFDRGSFIHYLDLSMARFSSTNIIKTLAVHLGPNLRQLDVRNLSHITGAISIIIPQYIASSAIRTPHC